MSRITASLRDAEGSLDQPRPLRFDRPRSRKHTATMSSSPAARTPYEVLGVSPTVETGELRKAYRRLLRETHPDTGGDPIRFHAVQVAWGLIGEPADRARYDSSNRSRYAPQPAGAGAGAGTASAGSPGSEPTGSAKGAWTAGTGRSAGASRPDGSSLKARSYGHPGGQSRELFLTLIREWVGRGTALPDPYDAALVHSAPREIRRALAKALAEESTARLVATLGIGYTVWNDVSAGRHGGKIDHIVLGPSGLYALSSDDWGARVAMKKGDLTGPAVGDGEQPLRHLVGLAKSLGRSLGVRFTGYALVVPDDDLDEPIVDVARGRTAGASVIRRSLLPQLLRNGGASGLDRTSVDRAFELRTRLQQGIELL